MLLDSEIMIIKILVINGEGKHCECSCLSIKNVWDLGVDYVDPQLGKCIFLCTCIMLIYFIITIRTKNKDLLS